MATKTFNDLAAGSTTPAGDELFAVWQSAATKKLTKAQTLTLLGLSPWSGTLYEEGSWTPTPTFATPGDLSVTSNTLVGGYQRIGSRCRVWCYGTFTPTWTTASGALQISGLPFTSAVVGHGPVASVNQRFTSYTGWLAVRIPGSVSYANIQINAPGAASAALTAASMTSAQAHNLGFSAEYGI